MLVNAMLLPSGDQTGLRSLKSGPVTGTRCPPFALMTLISPVGPPSVAKNAILPPSGDQSGQRASNMIEPGASTGTGPAPRHRELVSCTWFAPSEAIT